MRANSIRRRVVLISIDCFRGRHASYNIIYIAYIILGKIFRMYRIENNNNIQSEKHIRRVQTYKRESMSDEERYE